MSPIRVCFFALLVFGIAIQFAVYGLPEIVKRSPQPLTGLGGLIPDGGSGDIASGDFKCNKVLECFEELDCCRNIIEPKCIRGGIINCENWPSYDCTCVDEFNICLDTINTTLACEIRYHYTDYLCAKCFVCNKTHCSEKCEWQECKTPPDGTDCHHPNYGVGDILGCQSYPVSYFGPPI